MLNKIANKGFTLIEILIIIVIIAILALISIPYYQSAIIKSKVATMLPIMRGWYNANKEWYLGTGSLCKNKNTEGQCITYPDGADLGINWPKNWKRADVSISNVPCGDGISCYGDSWSCSSIAGTVSCIYIITKQTEEEVVRIYMFSENYPDETLKGRRICKALGERADRVCKTLGRFYLQEEKYKTYIF